MENLQKIRFKKSDCALLEIEWKNQLVYFYGVCFGHYCYYFWKIESGWIVTCKQADLMENRLLEKKSSIF